MPTTRSRAGNLGQRADQGVQSLVIAQPADKEQREVGRLRTALPERPLAPAGSVASGMPYGNQVQLRLVIGARYDALAHRRAADDDGVDLRSTRSMIGR